MVKESEPLETAVVKAIKRKLEKTFGGKWVKIHGGPHQVSGVSDLVGCLRGRFIALEVKRPSKRG